MVKRIQISDSAFYPGQSMKWTETFQGEVIIPAGTSLFHCSCDGIEAFYPKETCFDYTVGGRGHVYQFIVKRDIIGREYGDNVKNEVRVDLDRYRNDVEIFYIGTVEKERIRDEFGRVIKYQTIYNVTPIEINNNLEG
jgi:hypothetical protein